ncbi:MAG: cytochrome b/b6 domain-containing protein [Desulfovibrionaceae bacterium]|nr:cytochrome b/b6 domain-containing protein [Desulfovibrionaceae bacterium]
MFFRALLDQPERLWRFLGIFQSPPLRLAHVLAVFFVLLQLVSGVVMEIGSLASWYHMWAGANLCLLAVILPVYSLRARGPRHFYPYLWGDVATVKHDLRQAVHFKLPPPRPGGLGAVVQGVGLVFLALTAFSGLTWFVLWQTGSAHAETALTFHKTGGVLIFFYVVVHGGMATRHFIVWQRNSRRHE